MTYRPLLFHRKKNLFGSFFGDYAGWSSPVVSNGDFIARNITPPTPTEPDYTLSLNGTNSMLLSEPWSATGDFGIEVVFSTTVDTAGAVIGGNDGGTSHQRISVISGGVVESRFGSQVITGTIPVSDGNKHTITIEFLKDNNYSLLVDGVSEGSIGSLAAAINIIIAIGELFDETSKFQGTIYSVKLNDSTDPTNNIEWNIDSGPAKYSVGDEKHIAPNDFSNPVWTDFNSTHTADGTVTVTAAYGRMRQLVNVVAGEVFELTLDVKGISDYATLRFYAVGAGLNFSEHTPPITTEWQSLRWLVSIPIESDASDFECGVNQDIGLPVYQVRNFSLKPYIDTISDGTIYQDSETYGTLPDIMRADDWGVPPAGVTVSGRTATFDGTQVSSVGIDLNLSEQYTGLHYVVYKVTNLTLGSVRVNDSENLGGVAHTKNGVYPKYLNPLTGGSFRVVDDGSNADRFIGSVEIISVKPVPDGLIMQGVVEADWLKQGTVTNNGIAITHNGETVTNG